MPPTAGLKQETFMFHSSGVWGQRSGYQHGQLLVRALFLVSLNGREREKKTSYLLSLIIRALIPLWGFSGGSVVKNMPANAGDLGSILGWEDPLEREMATHSSTLAWEIAWTEEPGWTTVPGVAKSRHDWATEHAYPVIMAPPFWPKTSQYPCLHTSSHWGLGIWYRNLPRGYNIHSIRIILWVNCNYDWRVLFF